MVVLNNKQEDTSASLAASQTYSNGFTVYEGITASDFWAWTLSVDMPEGLVGSDYILYQWATMTNQDDPTEVYTVACKRTIGDDETFSVEVFTQDDTSSTVLFPAETNAEVYGKAWTDQAPDYKEEDDDHSWVATNDHHTLVGDSETDGNKIYACYLALELPKIGRNPADFDKTYDMTLGARLYENDSATTFTTIPSSTSSFEYPQPADFEVEEQVEGAYALFASTMAALAVLFMAF